MGWYPCGCAPSALSCNFCDDTPAYIDVVFPAPDFTNDVGAGVTMANIAGTYRLEPYANCDGATVNDCRYYWCGVDPTGCGSYMQIVWTRLFGQHVFAWGMRDNNTGTAPTYNVNQFNTSSNEPNINEFDASYDFDLCGWQNDCSPSANDCRQEFTLPVGSVSSGSYLQHLVFDETDGVTSRGLLRYNNWTDFVFTPEP